MNGRYFQFHFFTLQWRTMIDFLSFSLVHLTLSSAEKDKAEGRPYLAVNTDAVVEIAPLVGTERDLQGVVEARDESRLYRAETGELWGHTLTAFSGRVALQIRAEYLLGVSRVEVSCLGWKYVNIHDFGWDIDEFLLEKKRENWFHQIMGTSDSNFHTADVYIQINASSHTKWKIRPYIKNN